MTRTSMPACAILWAAAILAAAIVGAPHVLSLILLPSLAAMSLLTVAADARRAQRRQASC